MKLLIPLLFSLGLSNFGLSSAKAIPTVVQHRSDEHNATMEVINVGPFEAEPVPGSILPYFNDSDASKLAKKSPYNFGHYVCEHADYRGWCTEITCNVEEGTCCNLPPNWRNMISAWRPNSGIFCNLYEQLACGGSEYIKGFGYPGNSNLHVWYLVERDPPLSPLLRNFNDKLQSFRCWLR